MLSEGCGWVFEDLCPVSLVGMKFHWSLREAVGGGSFMVCDFSFPLCFYTHSISVFLKLPITITATT
jgi:hypothetical protein